MVIIFCKGLLRSMHLEKMTAETKNLEAHLNARQKTIRNIKEDLVSGGKIVFLSGVFLPVGAYLLINGIHTNDIYSKSAGVMMLGSSSCLGIIAISELSDVYQRARRYISRH